VGHGPSSARTSCLSRYFSAKVPANPIPNSKVLHVRARKACRARISRHIPTLRYETSDVCRLGGDTYTRFHTDLLAFLLIIHLACRSGVHQFKIPSLFRTIAQDTTCYFLVIFTSHLTLELTLIFGTVRMIFHFFSRQLIPLQPSIQLLPAG